MKREVVFAVIVLLPFLEVLIWAGAEWLGVKGHVAVALFTSFFFLCLVPPWMLGFGLLDVWLPRNKKRDDDSR